MSYVPKTIDEVISEYINRMTFLPAIQREYVWSTFAIEKLFDSIMGDFPIGTFLFWKIKEENKKEWISYEFIRNFDASKPHNIEANIAGVNQDIYLVLDGQQRLTSLYIGLLGSYKYFYYRWRTTKLYLNLFRKPEPQDDPEELTYQFQFRENNKPDNNCKENQFWYEVGRILDYEDSEDAKDALRSEFNIATEEEREVAFKHVGRLHNRIKTQRLLNYYEEKSQDSNKVLEEFIRVNTGGVKLEYSDILLSTATAQWTTLNAKKEIHSFTDEINTIGSGYSFGKDFVLKGCLYLTDNLEIQYRLKNFNRSNLDKIENNWDYIKENLEKAILLINKFGFTDKNLVAKFSLLPIALYAGKIVKNDYINSTDKDDVLDQVKIQKWLIFCLLKNAFGGSSDTKLKSLQEIIISNMHSGEFPAIDLAKAINTELSFSDEEIEQLLLNNYATRYSNLILSILSPDRDWKGLKFHEDHIFPKTEFTIPRLTKRGYNEETIKNYMKYYNSILNLELITDSENLAKHSKDFQIWIESRDSNFKTRNSIPELPSYSFDNFLEFIEERRKILVHKLKQIQI